MNKIKYFLTATVFCLFLTTVVSAAPLKGYENPYAVFSKNGLTITSFSQSWTAEKMEALYIELRQNHYGPELSYLSDVYLYPDAPIDAAGSYQDDIRLYTDGSFRFGKEANIALYNMDTFTDIESIAPTLSHEYGHHYTIYHISRYEKKLSTGWRLSEYAELRSLAKYPIHYDQHDPDYEYRYDVTEIAANDYVQLLGSPTAKKSLDFPDTQEVVTMNKDVSMPTRVFNCYPQPNTTLPLAADVSGLYTYFKKIAGETPLSGTVPLLTKRQAVTDILKEPSFKYPRYTLTFSAAEGNGPFEYTVVMYSADEPNKPIPVKTLSDGEPLSAVFGSVYRYEPDGSVLGIFEEYTGKHVIRVFAKDQNNFIYSSQAFAVDFGAAR